MTRSARSTLRTLAIAVVLGFAPLPAPAADRGPVDAATQQVERGANQIGQGKVIEGAGETAKGIGNIANAPLFMDAASGNFRLQSNSPCINAGRNADARDGSDLDGNPRIVGGTVDIGAYEFQSPQSALSYAWLQQYGLPTDGSADLTDPDGDGHNNWQEWRAWTDPTNSSSALRLLTPLVSTNGLLVRWQSVSGQNYFLERRTNLGALSGFAPFASNIVGQADTTVFADTNALETGPFFYRVRVNE